MRHFSEEHKRKLKEAKLKNPVRYWLGKKRDSETVEKIRLKLLGKPLSEKTKIIISQRLIEIGAGKWNKGKLLGNKNPAWKGGVSKDIEHLKKLRKVRNYRRIISRKRGGELTLVTIQQVYEDNIKRFGTLTCYLCLQPILFGNDNLEHKTPLSRGGTNARENLDIACEKCNCKKHTKTEAEYRKEAPCQTAGHATRKSSG